MKLSIVAIFCDSDYKLLPNLIANIKDKVNVSYEIILIDNRESCKHLPLNIPGEVRVYSQGYNTYQFEARRFAAQYCNGDYIWYIDADDSLMKVDEDLETVSGNLICFKYAVQDNIIHIPKTRKDFLTFFKGNEEKIISVTKEQIESNFNFWDIIGSTLWNKWVKKDFFIDLIKSIPINLSIVASEDIFYSALIYENTDKITLANYSVYMYNILLSKGVGSYINKERFFHIIYGRKTSRELFRKYFTDAEKYDNTSQSAAYFLAKILLIKKDDKLDCMKEMLNHFSKKEILKGIKHNWVSGYGKQAQLELTDLLSIL